MDFGLREWLLILGVLFIATVLLHGYWKMRANRNKLKMALDKSFMSRAADGEDYDDLELLRAELPNGGARVIKEPAQQDLDLEEDVPVLMEVAAESDKKVPEDVQEPEGGDRSSRHEGAGAGTRPEKIAVIHVLAREGKFNGQRLVEALVDLGMSWGDMEIFHRLDDTGRPLFSLANAVEPGTFDLATVDEMATPGVVMFMKAHELKEPLAVYNEMLQVAGGLAEELGGEIRDESRSVMTQQTIEHCRQDIKDYQLKYA